MADAPAKPKKHKRASSRRAHAIVPSIPEQPEPPEPAEPAKVPAVRGRPSIYTPELVKEICDRVAMGGAVYMICEEEGMPSTATVYRWLEEFADFRDNYERACKVKAEIEFDRLQKIADDGTNDWMEARDKEGAIMGWRVNGEAVQRSRLRAETLKWRLSMMNPRRFASIQRQEVSGPDGGPIEVMAVSARERITAIIMAGQQILPKPDDQDSIAPESPDDDHS